MPVRTTKPFYFVLLLVIGAYLSLGVLPAISQQAADGSAQNAPPPRPLPQTAIHPGQSRPFTFKTSVTEVVLYATVIDNHDHLVTSLQKQDFAVYENNVHQTIRRSGRKMSRYRSRFSSTIPALWRKNGQRSIAPRST